MLVTHLSAAYSHDASSPNDVSYETFPSHEKGQSRYRYLRRRLFPIAWLFRVFKFLFRYKFSRVLNILESVCNFLNSSVFDLKPGSI
jgi:hypothetical protein